MRPITSLLYLFCAICYSALIGILLVRPSPQVLGTTSLSTSDLLALVNVERRRYQLDPLLFDPLLSRAAQNKAVSMLHTGSWSHQTLADDPPWIFLDALDYHYTQAGENLARDFADSSAVIAAWLNSPGHRHNLLDPDFTHTGIAVMPGTYPDGRPTTIIVQFFATVPAPTPTLSVFSSLSLAPLLVFLGLGLSAVIGIHFRFHIRHWYHRYRPPPPDIKLWQS